MHELGAGCPLRKHCALRVTLLYWVPSHNSDIAWEPPGSSRLCPFVPNRTGRTLPALQTVKIKVSLFKLAASGGGFAVSVDPGTMRDACSPD